ncbi:MAG TPA: hypothetical protein VH331_12380 [Allosphingosinicella sp.]|jgi:hypothetical protein|nr:hypothetical protein [Allosphingosinicella sp.]
MLVSACGPTATSPARADRLNQLHAITSKCGLPNSALKLVGTKELHVQPPPDASYGKVECLLGELKKANLPLNIGFVGNEAYQPEDKNAPPH